MTRVGRAAMQVVLLPWLSSHNSNLLRCSCRAACVGWEKQLIRAKFAFSGGESWARDGRSGMPAHREAHPRSK